MMSTSKSEAFARPAGRRSASKAVTLITLASFGWSSLSPALTWAQTLDRSVAPEDLAVSRTEATAEGLTESGAVDQLNVSAPVEPEPREVVSKQSAEKLDPADVWLGVQAARRDLGTESVVTEPVSPKALPSGGADKSGVTSQAISVPQGAGKIDGMGESFSAQLSTGIATFSVPFSIPPARGAAQASLGLSYSSGSGSGTAGIGWSVGVPFIARETDRGLPKYDDRAEWHPEQDRFVFNGGQELVPICTVTEALACPCSEGGLCSGGALEGESMPPWSAGHQYFRPRVEGSFLRFFWSADHKTWRVQDKSGVTMELGVPLDGSGRRDGLETNPDAACTGAGPCEIYKWHLARQYDTYGEANPSGPLTLPAPVNVVVYQYFQDGGMAYLSDIFHTTPAVPLAEATTTNTAKYAHHVRLDYESRSDPTFSFRTGWRVDHGLRLTRVDVASKPFNSGVNEARRMVRRYHLTYSSEQHTSLLERVELEGRCTATSAGSSDSVGEDGAHAEADSQALPEVTGCPRLPAMSFGYEHVEPFSTDGTPGSLQLGGYEGFDERVRSLSRSPKHSIDEDLTDLFDIDSDGLPDVLATAVGEYGNGHGVFFNSNRGVTNSFGAPALMPVQGVLGANAASLRLSNLNLAPLDVDGDGGIDLLHMPKVQTYSIYRPTFTDGVWRWVGRAVDTASRQNPKIDFGQDTLDTKVVDVNFDGLVDVVVSTGTELQTFFALGRYAGGDGQFGSASWRSASIADVINDPVRTCVPHSTTPVRLSDQDIQFAEMNGDGIPDIVRVRRGDIQYWPGRGNGFWGTGRRDDCNVDADVFSRNRYIEMDDAPEFSDVQATTLRIDDVNGDGLDDLVQVRYDAVDIWLNVDGVGWTERHVIDGTPASPAFANRVRLVDVNGSGTRDILWGDGQDYKYIDLQGGKKPWLLTRVENGLGKSTDIQYTTSTAEMLAAERYGGGCEPESKPWSSPWCKKMPIVAHVVKRVTESNNLSVAGKGPGTYVTEYSYRDPVFEGRQREFRGFEKARSKRLGDENSPSDFTESTFLLGECKDETVGARDNGIDDCDVSERWRDNPREALKGLPTLSERYDERGVYLSTEATTYRLRRLYVGLDGREVRQAFASAQKSIVYDTALGAATNQGTAAVAAVELELAPAAFDAPSDDPLAIPTTVSDDEVRPVPIRQPTNHAEIASSSIVDAFGNRVVAVARGCVGGGACPTAQAGMKPDEPILSYTIPVELGATAWLWRTERSYVSNAARTEIRGETTTSYTPEGDPEETVAELAGALPLERAAAASLPASGALNGPILVASRSYSSLGSLIQETGANGRCREVGYDGTYGALATSESIHRDGTCDDPSPLVVAGAYDRGLGAVTTAIDMQLQPTFVAYDGFGRLAELRRPVVGAGAGTPRASVKVEYLLPSASNPVAYSVIHTMAQDGESSFDDAYLESYAYVDGLGRTVVTLSEADPSAGDEGAWIADSLQEYDAKGAVRRKYLASFYDGAPLAFPLASVPNAPYGRQRYDAFGRQAQTFDIDGTVTLQSRYHALSTDLFDASDLESGPHQDTPASTQQDGHGRAISATERIHVGGAIEERHTRTQYLITGEPEVITRVRGAGLETVTRWMRYDSLGRMVLNVEPNTTGNFDPDPETDPMPGSSGLKAWRYLYNDAGDLVGTSDARGCGQNFFYDGAGRLLAEDYAPCESHHAAYSTPDLQTSAGTEVFYVYDRVPEDFLPSFARPADYSADSPFLKGRLAAVFAHGATTWATYDQRGRVVQSDVRISKPADVVVTSFANRYALPWHTKEFAYDAADREVASATGSTRPNLQGSAVTDFGFDSSRDKSVVTTEYTERGTVKSVGGSHGALVQSIDRSADGLVNDIVYGDAASTTTAFSYDNRRRLRNVQTYRGPPEIWNSPPPAYQPAPVPNAPTSFQLVLQDEDYTYDSVNNPIIIRDWRSADEWPDGAKPATRKLQYDDLNRVKRVDYQYPAGDDTWTSPFASELNGPSDPRRAQPSPHVSFARRIQWQTFDYDWLGNSSKTDDDAKGFYDRSLGTVTNDVAGSKPYQLKGATNSASGGARTGAAGATYDVAGNLTRLDVRRDGPCLGSGACSQRFEYRWDEVGRLARARRWDVASLSVNPSAPLPPDAAVVADLRYVYDESDQRVLKTAAEGAASSHTVYVFDSLELRRTTFSGNEYAVTTGTGNGLTETEVPYLFANGVRLARIVHERGESNEPRLDGTSRLHVFFELGDHLGSTSVVLDQATSELVERSTHQPYGAAESDYRPDRWAGFREDYRFTGKEEDIEVGLQYFGKRYLSPYLGRWVSADPLAVHSLGEADINLYAYVAGALLKDIDPIGLTQKESELYYRFRHWMGWIEKHTSKLTIASTAIKDTTSSLIKQAGQDIVDGAILDPRNEFAPSPESTVFKAAIARSNSRIDSIVHGATNPREVFEGIASAWNATNSDERLYNRVSILTGATMAAPAAYSGGRSLTALGRLGLSITKRSGGLSLVEILSAAEANAFNAVPAYSGSVAHMVAKRDLALVRVYTDGVNGAKGKWAMAAEDIEGLTGAQIQQKFALPTTPTHVVDVRVQAGTHLRMGRAGENKWGKGGGIQFEATGEGPRYQIDPASARTLPQ